MKRITCALLATIITLSMAACTSGGVSQEEYDKVVFERDIAQGERDALNNRLSEIDILRVSPNDKSAIENIIQKFIDDGIPINYKIIFDNSNDPNGGGLQSYLAKGNFADSNCEPSYSKEEPQSGTIEVFDSYESAVARVNYLKSIEEDPGNENRYNYNIINENVLLRLNSRFSQEYIDKYVDSFGGTLHTVLNGPKGELVEWVSYGKTIAKDASSSKSSEKLNNNSSSSANAKEPPTSNSAVVKPTSETIGQKNALRSAKSYLNYTSFSYKSLIEQLEYEKFSHEDAVYAADNCGADWNEQAVKSAKSYLDYTSFSRDSLIEQLEYSGFTHEQAVYGAEANGY